MCHDMCKCFGRVGENREGMETGDAGCEDGGAAICVAPAKGATVDADRLGSHVKDFNPRSRAARHIALHELLGVQYACQEDRLELQQTAENISQIL